MKRIPGRRKKARKRKEEGKGREGGKEREARGRGRGKKAGKRKGGNEGYFNIVYSDRHDRATPNVLLISDMIERSWILD